MSLDPEVLQSFLEESRGLIKELEGVVDQLSETSDSGFPAQALQDFAQRIDRIMGAAKTMEMIDPGNPAMARIGKLAEICKYMGYKAAEKKDAKLIPLFAAFWADTLEVVSELLDTVNDAEENAEIARGFVGVLQKRLEWLSSHVTSDMKNLVQQFG